MGTGNMIHVKIVFLVLNLVAGAVVFLEFRQAALRFRNPVLSYLKGYILFFNLLIGAYFYSNYLYTNVLRGPLFENPLALVAFFSRAMLFLTAEYGILVTLVFVFFGSSSKLPPSPEVKLFLILGTMALLGPGYGMFSLWMKEDTLLLSLFELIWEFFWNLFLLIIMVLAWIRSRNFPDLQQHRGSLALILGAGYLIYFIPNIYYYLSGKGVGLYLDSLVLLLINVAPLLWLRRIFLQGRGAGLLGNVGDTTGMASLEGVLTVRELEIVSAICRGESNQEIADRLFLSFHTVKNHIYRIYQKLGIQNRSQLTGMVLGGESLSRKMDSRSVDL
jgi:DNA-binding CsgD family transcriptional regulator